MSKGLFLLSNPSSCSLFPGLALGCGQVLASRLQQSGNTATFTFAPSAIHDDLGAYWTRETRRALHRVNQLLRE